ncbi:hypothetical protein O4H61_00410 [Roseovarius aestuarii]|nr:hypothetical protein [Roseovarius aestuarii]
MTKRAARRASWRDVSRFVHLAKVEWRALAQGHYFWAGVSDGEANCHKKELGIAPYSAQISPHLLDKK